MMLFPKGLNNLAYAIARSADTALVSKCNYFYTDPITIITKCKVNGLTIENYKKSQVTKRKQCVGTFSTSIECSSHILRFISVVSYLLQALVVREQLPVVSLDAEPLSGFSIGALGGEPCSSALLGQLSADL